jgi:PEP-CTERM motif
MIKRLFETCSVGGLLLLACSVQAYPILPTTNLNFLSYTGVAPMNQIFKVMPTGWTSAGTNDKNELVFIATPGDASILSSACGNALLQTYGCPSTLAIPGGYNYVEADGNPLVSHAFSQTITGLTAGQTYTLGFYQAGSQQAGFANGLNTTEQWIVSLGTDVLKACAGCGPVNAYYGEHDSTYSNSDLSASIVATSLMTTPPGGMTDWQYVSVNLTADASTQILSFLAWGDNGNTLNIPPIVFLAGNSPSSVPEPETLALFGLGLLGLGASKLRRPTVPRATA